MSAKETCAGVRQNLGPGGRWSDGQMRPDQNALARQFFVAKPTELVGHPPLDAPHREPAASGWRVVQA
jgi:hypothetical protein